LLVLDRVIHELARLLKSVAKATDGVVQNKS